MKRLLPIVIAGLSFALGGSVALAQAWPAKPVKVIVPFAPGGPADQLGRMAAQAVTVALGQPGVVENKVGAGGALGNGAAARAPADGYTLLMSLSSISILPEADRLLDLGFADEIGRVLAALRMRPSPPVVPAAPAASLASASVAAAATATARCRPATPWWNCSARCSGWLPCWPVSDEPRPSRTMIDGSASNSRAFTPADSAAPPDTMASTGTSNRIVCSHGPLIAMSISRSGPASRRGTTSRAGPT